MNTATTPHVTHQTNGNAIVVLTPEQQSVMEGKDTLARISLCERIAEQLFVSRVVQLTATEEVQR